MKQFNIMSLIIAASLLSACGNNAQNDIATQEANLKKEVKDLKTKVEDEKTNHITKKNTLNATNSELKQQDKSTVMSNNDYMSYFNTYATNLGLAIKDYSSIEDNLTNNDAQSKDELKSIHEDVKSAIEQYDDHFKKTDPPATFADIHKQVEDANMHIKEAMDEINDGYQNNDDKKLQDGKTKLHNAIDTFNEITIK
ncbi:DUF6376 family protein [Macrococcus armenti]|uniref:DUF6376 family protein n=1 Tax=Macrococcus armenti TaxID=2875764 RepID=UPI001CCE37B9|nr:DUF6376 family protein [Macrococcus armenti]UBH14465.1 DUF6376 family protein [Macrococcus armenti]UBH16824.1 DUF6376 family protein [Macrococcus armenti]UBH19088.1 DUF6376 family protein [Macrococcus armenti]